MKSSNQTHSGDSEELFLFYLVDRNIVNDLNRFFNLLEKNLHSRSFL